jgi:hypothetical protein
MIPIYRGEGVYPIFPNRNPATKPEKLSKTTSSKEYFQPKSTGAEALFLLCARYAAVKAPLFHGRAGEVKVKTKVKSSEQECPLHTSRIDSRFLTGLAPGSE